MPTSCCLFCCAFRARCRRPVLLAYTYNPNPSTILEWQLTVSALIKSILQRLSLFRVRDPHPAIQ